MTRFPRLGPQSRRSPKLRPFRPEVEALERRSLMSASSLAPLIELEANDTLNVAQQLGDLSGPARVEVLGSIGNGPTGAADVDFYRFTLGSAAHVNLSIVGRDGTSQPILSLYNSNPDPYDFSDPFAISGHRLVQQTADDRSRGELDRDLAAGTYFVAISGSGNRYFHPFLAGSGYDGQVGGYRLIVDAKPRLQNAGDGPSVLATDPHANAPLAGSPFVVRIDLDAQLDPNTLNPGGNVRLIYNAAGTFGDGNDLDVYLSSYYFSPGLMELQLTPGAPLQPGYYQIFLQGDASLGDFVLTDPNGVFFGANEANPFGQNFTSTFQITGIEGQLATDPSKGADDTLPFARDLGELKSGVLLQLNGDIGDDPYYDVNNPDLYVNPASDVDLYHFHVTGPARYAFSAEVFGGRIGSPLDAGVSLFRWDTATQRLVLVGGNNNTNNSVRAANDTLPFFLDPAFTAGLTEGDYYLSVTSNFNTPTPGDGFEPGSNGIFDPNVSHSGTAGSSTGPYVLNLFLRADGQAPSVVATTPTAGERLDAPPAMLVVQFSEAMNLRTLYFDASTQKGQNTIAAVYLEGADGTRYFPRLDSYDADTNTATFLMMDGLTNGAYTLHLSSALGLSDMAGLALEGSGPDGDFVVSFSVAGVPRGVKGDPLQWAAQENNDTVQQPQDIGVLFPHELQAGVAITRAVLAGATDTADYFKFEVLQSQKYALVLNGVDLPRGTRLAITDLAGNPIGSFSATSRSLVLFLKPGAYLVRVDGWTADEAGTLEYELRLEIQGNSDNAPALTTGPAPALQLRLVGTEASPFLSPRVFVPTPSRDGPSAPRAGSDRLLLVSFPTPSFLSQGAGFGVPSGVLLQLARTPLGGIPATAEPGISGTMDRVLLESADAAVLAELPSLSVVPTVPAPSESGASGDSVPTEPNGLDALSIHRWSIPRIEEVAAPEAASDTVHSVLNPEAVLEVESVDSATTTERASPVRVALWLTGVLAAVGASLFSRRANRRESTASKLKVLRKNGEAEKS